MKKEYRAAARRAIKDSANDLNGYTWTVTPDGLRWSYGETFQFVEQTDEWGSCLFVETEYNGTMAHLLIGPNSYDDARTMEEAYYKATRETIYQANRLY